MVKVNRTEMVAGGQSGPGVNELAEDLEPGRSSLEEPVVRPIKKKLK